MIRTCGQMHYTCGQRKMIRTPWICIHLYILATQTHHQEQAPCWSIAVSTVCLHCSRFCARFQAVCRPILSVLRFLWMLCVSASTLSSMAGGSLPVTRQPRNYWSQHSCVVQPDVWPGNVTEESWTSVTQNCRELFLICLNTDGMSCLMRS